jgi:hypothetical protein
MPALRGEHNSLCRASPDLMHPICTLNVSSGGSASSRPARESGLLQVFPGNGASRARTGDLLGAIQRQRDVVGVEERAICRDYRRFGVDLHGQGAVVRLLMYPFGTRAGGDVRTADASREPPQPSPLQAGRLRPATALRGTPPRTSGSV